ncbi:MAG: response regulator [Singulisphaera sp.]
MSHQSRSNSHIVVVDSQPQHFRDLQQLAGEQRLHLHFLTSAGAALEFAPRGHPALWMVNTRLPDMSGLELVARLRQHAARGCLCSIADRYRQSEEREACVQGADLYLCKDAASAMECRTLLDSLWHDKNFNVLDGPAEARRASA